MVGKSRPVPREMVGLWVWVWMSVRGRDSAVPAPGRACVTLEGASVTGKGWEG